MSRRARGRVGGGSKSRSSGKGPRAKGQKAPLPKGTGPPRVPSHRSRHIIFRGTRGCTPTAKGFGALRVHVCEGELARWWRVHARAAGGGGWRQEGLQRRGVRVRLHGPKRSPISGLGYCMALSTTLHGIEHHVAWH